ncbi:hypothetical protein D5086_032459 [Populus alba]|uniref:Uncharacterized protein n=1 Tax=Populus alba TaxID=43335 RepID=A0ACC4ALD6_POPAL
MARRALEVTPPAPKTLHRQSPSSGNSSALLFVIGGMLVLAWKLYERSSVIDLVDPKLREHGFMEKDVLLVIHVAFLCLQPLANLRPPMSKIEALLTCKVEMVGTPMRPAFLERRRKTDENLSWDAISECSVHYSEQCLGLQCFSVA